VVFFYFVTSPSKLQINPNYPPIVIDHSDGENQNSRIFKRKARLIGKHEAEPIMLSMPHFGHKAKGAKNLVSNNYKEPRLSFMLN